MENTLENKAKYFAQYWGQKVILNSSVFMYIGSESMRRIEENHYIELKPLSSITNEDANAITIYGEYAIKNGGFNDFGFDTPQGKQMYGYSSVDFLRLKGYAIGWMGLSVKQLIEYGWLKIKS